MSSIDKGVEQVVNRLGRNVKVVKRGNTIYGIMNGEVIFSLADRYGYINEREESIIRNGIRRYDEEERVRRQRVQEEQRARREAIQREKEAAERQRQMMLEQERVAAHKALKNTISKKREELNRALEKCKKAQASINIGIKRREDAVKEIAGLCSIIDLSQFSTQNSADALEQRAQVEKNAAKYREKLSELDTFAKGVTANMTTSQYNKLNSKANKITAVLDGIGNAEYQNTKFLDELQAIKSGIKEILPAISELQSLANTPGEVGIVAREALSSISSGTVKSSEDIAAFAKIAESRLTKIAHLIEDEKISSDLSGIAVVKGAIAACQKTYEISVNSTYSIKDYRDEIESSANEIIIGYEELSTAEYSTCASERIVEIIRRLEDILERGEMGESVLREVEGFANELREYKASDEAHRSEYNEYLSIVGTLKEYGVSAEEIKKFDATNYSDQKKVLAAMVATEKREFERSQLIITDMQVKNVMEDMGYELFSSIGDADGYVREALFTKPGYDGVLWQVISYANGSVTRRVIGVNKGETETDIEYVKEVAAEMEKSSDPEEFVRRFRDESDSKITVTAATEHNSENADQIIKKNGYHYLSGEALELYNRKVEERPTQQSSNVAPTQKKVRQVKVASGNAISNSSVSLREAASKSRAMSHAG